MLLDLLKQGIIDKRTILLENYRKVGLNEKQVIIVLLIMELNKDQNRVITSTELEQYMSMNNEKIDNEIDNMITKGYVKINSKYIDFTNLFIAIAEVVESEYSDFQEDSFIRQINKLLNQKISLNDINYLNSKVLSNITKEDILELAKKEEVGNFEQLKNLIERNLNKKPKSITKFNWLLED